MNPTRRMYSIVSTLVILAMLLQAVPVRADDFAPPTPTPTAPPTPTPTSTATATETPTETASPTPEATPTATGTPIGAPAGTPYPAPGEPVTSAPTVTPSETPSPSPTATSVPTQTLPSETTVPTPTPPADQEPPAAELALLLSASDGLATPGGSLGLGWKIDDWQDSLKDLALKISTTQNLAPNAGVYDPRDDAYLLPVNAAEEWIQWEIPVDQEGPYTFTAELTLEGKVVATHTLSVPEAGLTRLSVAGGLAEGLNGKVRVLFPPEAAGEELDVRVRPLLGELRSIAMGSSHAFEIVARSAASKAEVTQFKTPLTIEVAYQGREDANLFYYDEANGKWEALPSEYDREAGVVRGYSDHLTIFNIDVNSWQSSQLPGMNGFQVSQFSGSATYDYPIWTPPGPGGLQPVLSLSYNSLSVDSAYAQRTQASWVGMGWSLQTGSITRDMHGTITADGDDTMNLSLNGVSSRLLMDSSGVYHMADENFWKVSYSGDVWTLYDKVGNRYVFGGYNGVASTAARGFFPDFPGAQAPCTQAYGDLVHRWMLTEIIDKFGNKLEYLYHPKESKQVDRTCSGDEAHTVDMAIYLKEIRYSGNDGRYRIFFDIAQNRFDYPTNWNDPHQYTFWERSRLQAIRVVHDPDGSGAGAGVAVRTYQFTYDDFIYPGWEWGSGGRSFVLTKIEEIGLNSQHLPDVTFTYDDLHLTNASNGYGGEVEFTYESSPWIETGVNTEEFGYYYEETCPAGWTGVSCETGNKIRVSSEGKHDFGMNAVRPGSGYLVSLPFLNLGSTGSATVLLQYSDNPGDRVTVGTATSQNPGVNAAVVLPTSAGATTHLFIIVQCTNCLFDGDDVKIWAAPTYYRVIERELSDSGESVTTGYNYDGPATNDAAHSDLVRDHLSTLYGEAYDEYRGHAMVREQSPDGYVTTSFFHQDDDLTGRSSVSLVGTQSYYQPFSDTSWSSYSSAWTYWTTQPTFERQDGDLAAKVVYSGGGWQGMLHRNTYSLTSGKNAVVQFRVAEDAGGNQEAVFALESGTIGSNYQSWRVYLKQDGTLWSSYCTTSGGSTTCSFQNQLYSANEFKLNTWYVLMLIADDTNGFYLRVWPREDPGAVKSDRRSFSIASWRFAGYVNYGTMWLDEYSEGVLYSLSSSEAETEESIFATSTMFDDYPDLTIDWTRALTETQLSFEGTSRWLGIRTLFAYNPSEQTGTQYGNLTRTYNEEWIENPPYYTGWYRDRVTVTGYYPPSGGNPYLVGLPGYTNTYRCNGAPCASPGSADLLSSHWYLYDDHSSYNQAPSFGELTGERDLLRFAGANYTDPRYRDLRYDHDSYGNLTSTSAWSGEGTLSSPASAGKRTSTITYDATYHTYALAQTDPLGFVTTLTYDYNFGSPLSETDINGNTTSAGYDNFGRITSVRRPGDESGAATMTFTYADFPGTGVPYYTEATQKIDSSTTYRVRKYYDGLGRLLQTHVIGASINGATKDVLVDSFYDSAGRQWKQTVPYEATSGAYWHNRSGSQPYAETLYDEMGRVYQSKATDGSVQAEYSYTSGYYPSGSNGMDGRGYAETCVLDAMLRETCTKTDLRGRANEVHAPAEPWLRYTYDEAGRLTGAEQMAGSTPQTSTQLFYDLAGRKTQMNDPDMGTWYYQYDATGALTRQTDARGQTLLMNYDPLYRLTSKGKLTFEDLFNTKDTGSWTYNAYQVVPYNDNGSNVVKNTGTGVDWAAGFRRNGYSLASGKALQLRFKVSDSNSSVHLMIENNDATYRRFAAYNVNGKLYSQYNVGGGYYMGNTLLESFLANVWYVLRITVDDVNGFKVEAYREDNPNEYGSYTNAMVSGKTWRFNTTTKYGIEYVDDYQEMDVLARYSYDDYNPGSAQWGKGLRTGMIDSSGSTYWRYDQRGRMRWEDKWIGSIDHFVTEWSYNSADLLAWMKYPGGDGGQQGEQVTYRYYPQMTIQDTMGSDGGNNYYYLQQAQYDAAGRADLLRLGAASLLANSVLLRDYRYHDWTRPNGQGRLMWIKSGIFNNPTSLQDLRFYTGSDASPSPSYDAVGNILGIYDYKAGSPQTQSFGYDDLDRLTSAQATGGTIGLHGVYNQETYAYDSLGRLTGLPSLGTYSYNPSVSCAAGNRTLPHAVASVSNNSYAYDCNGNMTTRTLGGNNTFNFTYDAENRLSGVSGAATNSYYYDGDSKRVKEVTYENLAAGIPFTSSAAIYFPEAGTDGDTYPNSGAGDSGEFAAVWSGNHYAQLDLGSTYSVDKIRVWHFFADGRTYHGVKLQVSANGTSWTTIYDSAVQGEYAETSAGKTHTFSAQSVRYVREYLNGSTANAGDHWVEMEVFGSRTNVMIGDYFEWNENSGTMVKYYYAGSERIAMREGTGTLTTGLKWLLGDHLGSTSISAQGSDGAKLSELRFKPFGELRFAWGTTTTSLRYTGQRAEGTGLYDYKARFYDPMLGRFIQPDTIIPDPGNPLDWDRYAYVRNNALRYTDPSGHDVCDEDGNCFEGRRYRKINGQRRDVPLTENGAVVAALYRKMRNIVNDKWNPDGDLTIEEFLGLWILHEANGIPEHAAAIASAVAQSLYVGGYNPAYCSGACRNGLFNYMGAQSQLAGGLFTGTTNLNSYSGPPKFASQPWTMEDVAKYGNDALHPKSLDWDRNDAPSNWGGAAKWGDALSKAGIEPLTVNGTGKDTIYFYNGVFVVFSVNQRYNWCLKGVDTSMDTNPPTVNFTCDY